MICSARELTRGAWRKEGLVLNISMMAVVRAGSGFETVWMSSPIIMFMRVFLA